MRALVTIVVTFMCTLVYSQPAQLSNKTIASSTSSGVVIVEFGAAFAQPFGKWESVTDCEYYRVDIGKYPEVKSKYKVRSIPTIMLFNNGVRVDAWKANIMFELDVTVDEIQSSIDNILSDKF
jgi:thioredoxin-like negative regulator of GroEL|tara:strand:+ start:848 stop:1216 length:369 start_codon:yes stop_codon:yes gene_type:complete